MKNKRKLFSVAHNDIIIAMLPSEIDKKWVLRMGISKRTDDKIRLDFYYQLAVSGIK